MELSLFFSVLALFLSFLPQLLYPECTKMKSDNSREAVVVKAYNRIMLHFVKKCKNKRRNL